MEKTQRPLRDIYWSVSGTSSLKAILIDDDQRVLAIHVVPLTVSLSHAGWSGQDPSKWLEATVVVIKALGAFSDPSDVRAMGLSGHMHGATLLDASDAVLPPAFCGTIPGQRLRLLSWTQDRSLEC